MKSTIATSLTFILSVSFLSIVGCGNQPTNIGGPSDQIIFSSDRTSYAESDTIRLFLNNSSRSDINVGMRCGFYLEMFYQKRDNHNWGDTLWFPYMSLRCLTLLDTVVANTILPHSIPAEIFHSTGTFRLTVDVYVPKTGTSQSILSNSFEIR